MPFTFRLSPHFRASVQARVFDQLRTSGTGAVAIAQAGLLVAVKNEKTKKT